MQLVQITFIMHIPCPSSPPLCCFGVAIAHQMTSIAQLWCPVCVRPNPGPFPVQCTIHAVVNTHKGNVLHEITRFQQARIWVFQEPYTWLQTEKQFKTSLHQLVCLLQVSWFFRSRSGPRVLRAIWTGPYDIKKARFVRAIPIIQIHHMRWPVTWVNIYFDDLPAILHKRPRDRTSTRTQIQKPHLNKMEKRHVLARDRSFAGNLCLPHQERRRMCN